MRADATAAKRTALTSSEPFAQQALHELEHVLPKLHESRRSGDEISYKGSRAGLLISAALDHLNAAPGGPPDKLLLHYFPEPATLAGHLTKLRAQTIPGQEQLFAGAVAISRYQHHAAVIGLVKADRSAVLVLDSLISTPINNDAVKVRDRRYKATALRRSIAKQLPCVGSGFEHTLFDAVRKNANTSVYYAYTGLQASSRDCASFSVDALRTIQNSTVEQLSHYSFLDYATSAEPTAKAQSALPGIRRAVEVSAPKHGITNQHFVLNGEALLPPQYYVHAQSRGQLARYCKTSPLVDEATASHLKLQHEAGRRNMRIPKRIRGTKIREANYSIRQAQIDLLEAAAADFRARLKDAEAAPGSEGDGTT